MEELTCCEGTVHSIIFQNAENGYTVLRLLTEEGEVITVVGCVPCVAPGEHQQKPRYRRPAGPEQRPRYHPHHSGHAHGGKERNEPVLQQYHPDHLGTVYAARVSDVSSSPGLFAAGKRQPPAPEHAAPALRPFSVPRAKC